MVKMINLKEFCLKWKLTQAACAKEVGVSLQTWLLWEREVGKPSLDNWEKLQRFLRLYEDE